VKIFFSNSNVTTSFFPHFGTSLIEQQDIDEPRSSESKVALDCFFGVDACGEMLFCRFGDGCI
jgi:hypothetical protein